MNRREIVTALFAAWSSGDLDAPKRFLAEDAVLWDSGSGEHRGRDGILTYFGQALGRWPDLVLEPTGEFWERPDGLALTWTMSATCPDDRLGPGTAGRKWTVPGMSSIRFDGDDRVVHEADFHDKGARARSLGIDG